MGIRTIQEVEDILKNIHDVNHPFMEELLKDERKGIKQILNKWKKKLDTEQQLREKFNEMTSFEKKYRNQGYQWIAGIDEVGRGPLAGPVVAAAVVLPFDIELLGIDDSKKLSEKKREDFYIQIKEKAIAIGVGIVDADVIDEINIYQATKKAMNIAIHSLTPKPDVLLIDAMKLGTPYIEESIIKGDAKSISIAAASIIAKVTRDKLMQKYSCQYPEYQFEQNMGYGTKDHLKAIDTFGVTPIHRKSFSPIKEKYEYNLFVLAEK